jgi:mannosylglucosylglycerate synthase
MNVKYLNIGILHSLIGKNDGVSIVIDQTVNAMVNDMDISLGNIFFLAAHTSPRFNADTNEVFWHKNEIHKKVIQYFNDEPPKDLEQLIHINALYAKKIIKEFIDKHEIDLLIAHNTSHPYNFITAVGLGYYIEELRQHGKIWPKTLIWWHDSYFERERFGNPNNIIQKYLKYLPGTDIDGIAFINKSQPGIAERLFQKLGKENIKAFFRDRTVVIPNTSDVPWGWESQNWYNNSLIAPPADNYNDSFFRDIGLTKQIQQQGFTMEDTVILLQHTRIVPRKKIEVAIDFAFRLEQRFRQDDKKKCIALVVSGHSGDEQVEYKKYLKEFHRKKLQENPDAKVLLIFGESCILSHRDIIVDKKYYKFAEVPAIIARAGGIGTYFSEVEGYGNNLLEMVCYGLPVVINKYDVYKTDIEELGFDFPSIEECTLTDEVVEQAYMILIDYRIRNSLVFHNLTILNKQLDHKIIGKKLGPLIRRIFTKTL